MHQLRGAQASCDENGQGTNLLRKDLIDDNRERVDIAVVGVATAQLGLRCHPRPALQRQRKATGHDHTKTEVRHLDETMGSAMQHKQDGEHSPRSPVITLAQMGAAASSETSNTLGLRKSRCAIGGH
jgi:hypothetical protein